jgi:DMSO reductase anchor subunit
MRPQYSIIFLTTLIGMAQGMLFSAAILNLYAPVMSNPFLSSYVFSVALILLLGGLTASFFHLGHPERAWRSATMWRTSWLSREVIALPALIAITILAEVLSLQEALNNWIWVALIVTCIALWICTAQIYQCIRFIQEWSHISTMINFFILGLSSGWLLLSILFFTSEKNITPLNKIFFPGIAFLFIFIAFNLKLWIWNRNRSLAPKSNLASATGIQGKQIRQTSMGLMGGSFNTREFFHHQTDKIIANIRKIILISAYLLPMILIAIAFNSASPIFYLCLALFIQYGGLIAERWMFFAEANHPQNLYYQRVS